MQNECLDKLINDHWAYVEEILQCHVVNTDIIEIVEFHYKTAFKHGWKHAVEDGDCVQNIVDFEVDTGKDT